MPNALVDELHVGISDINHINPAFELRKQGNIRLLNTGKRKEFEFGDNGDVNPFGIAVPANRAWVPPIAALG